MNWHFVVCHWNHCQNLCHYQTMTISVDWTSCMLDMHNIKLSVTVALSDINKLTKSSPVRRLTVDFR